MFALQRISGRRLFHRYSTPPLINTFSRQMIHKEKSSSTPRQLRQFAAASLVFLLALGAHQWFIRGHHRAGIVLAVLAFVVGVPGLIKPSAIRWIYAGA